MYRTGALCLLLLCAVGCATGTGTHEPTAARTLSVETASIYVEGMT